MVSNAAKIFTLPVQKTGTQKIAALRRSPARRMTRAHLTLAARPSLARRWAGLLGQVAEHLSTVLGVEVELEGRLAESAVLPLDGFSRYGTFALFELAHFAQPATLELERRTLGMLLETLSGEPSNPGPLLGLTSVEEAAFGWLLLEALSVVRKDELFRRCFSPRLMGLHDQRGQVLDRIDGRVRHLSVELSVRVGDRMGMARLLVPGRIAQAALQELPADVSGALPEEIGQAQLKARCFAGRAVLSAREANELKPHDVVLLDGLQLRDGALCGALRLRSSSFELHGELKADAFTLRRTLTSALTKEDVMSKEEQTDLLPALPVEVEVELTRVNLRIGELATLRPGAVIPLRISPIDPVTLRVGDRAIARAELVEIDGELGARIIGLGQ